MRRIDTRLFVTVLLLMTLAALAGLFLSWIGIDALEGRNHLQFFADSETYHAAARGDLIGLQGPADFISLGGNFLGPVLLLDAVGQNYYLMMLLNVVFLFFSVTSIARSLKLDVLRFTLLLVVNPLTLSSILSVNKEIVSLVFVALFLRMYTSRSFALFLCALLTSILVRWQLTLFLLTFVGIVSPLNPVRRRRFTVIVALLLGMSVLYVALSPLFEAVRYSIETSVGDYQGSGAFELLSSIQDRGGYILIFPLKAAHMLFASGLRLDRLVAPRDVYNDTWQLLHSTMTLVIFVSLCVWRRFRLRDDLIYVSIIYIALFGISPIYSPRYFYPVYVLWVAALVASTTPVRFLPGLPAQARSSPPAAAVTHGA